MHCFPVYNRDLSPEEMLSETVNVLHLEKLPEMFSDDENSDEEVPSIRAAPRRITRGIGYFIQATNDEVTVYAGGNSAN